MGYESAYRCHIQSKWGGVDMESITASDIEEWLGSFKRAGAARKAWAVLRAILRLAYRRGVTDNDVTRREIRLPHLRHYEPQVLSAPEVRRLLKGFYGHPLEAWLLVSVCAGLRRCESVGVEWADLDLRRGTVTVKRSVQWVAGHETVTEPKTDLSRRTVALPRFAVKRLAELRHGTKTGRLVGSLNANQVANHYRSWCKRMKLPCVPPRNLRHTFGTLAIKAGTDISVVARQLGHSDIQTTARYYLKPDLSVLKDMQKAWQKLILTC
ncbi:tyrosine-type recombinase/integrase [Bifidobacterium pseudocatenulatum]|uniref:tyrosine-type recombinase/integrase n=2 Tax=Bifidobacterium pseudocatenulatum TaxID=28026 RepID=UPI0034A29E58